jgi:plastocyanin
MKKAFALFAMVLAATAIVACGGDDDDNGDGDGGGAAATTTEPTGGGGGGGAAGGETLQLAADPNGALAYDTDTLNAKAGNVTIDLTNDASISHDVAVEDSGGSELGKSDLIANGETSSLDLSNLEPGEYTFFCTVPGHREGGMEGTLTVE